MEIAGGFFSGEADHGGGFKAHKKGRGQQVVK